MAVRQTSLMINVVFNVHEISNSFSGIETGLGEFLSCFKSPALHRLPMSRRSLCSQSLPGFLESCGAAVEASECPIDSQGQSHT